MFLAVERSPLIVFGHPPTERFRDARPPDIALSTGHLAVFGRSRHSIVSATVPAGCARRRPEPDGRRNNPAIARRGKNGLIRALRPLTMLLVDIYPGRGTVGEIRRRLLLQHCKALHRIRAGTHEPTVGSAGRIPIGERADVDEIRTWEQVGGTSQTPARDRPPIAQQTVPFREVLPSIHFEPGTGEARHGAAKGEDPPARASAQGHQHRQRPPGLSVEHIADQAKAPTSAFRRTAPRG